MCPETKPNGAETAAAYTKGEIPEGVKCTLRRDLFSHCSYCSCDIGKGPGWLKKDVANRCGNCGWVYCNSCVNSTDVEDDDVVCDACLDAKKANDCLARGISLVGSVIVVGTGMGGLAAALALKNRGVNQVTILERTAELRTSGGPINVQTNAMRALLDIDPKVMEQVFDSAGPLDDDGAFKTIDGKVLFASKLSTAKESRWGNPEGRSVVRGNLQMALFDRCIDQGIDIKFGVKVTGVEQADTSVTVIGETDNDGDEKKEQQSFSMSADLLVASDGIWSKVRQSIFPEASLPVYQGYQMLVSRATTSDFDQMEMDCWGELWAKGHRFGFFRCGEGGTAIYYARTCEEQLDSDKTQEQLKQILIDSVTNNGYDEKVVQLCKVAEVSRLYRFPIRYMEPLPHHVSKRVVLLGDAANAMPPNLGQGGGMALESASILSQCLLIGDTLEDAFAKYEKRRIGRVSLVAKASKTNGDLFQASNALTVFLRNALFGFLGKQATKEGVDVVDLPDPFAYLFSYRLLSWPHSDRATN